MASIQLKRGVNSSISLDFNHIRDAGVLCSQYYLLKLKPEVSSKTLLSKSITVYRVLPP